MTLSRLITRITILLIAGGLALSGSVRLEHRTTSTTRSPRNSSNPDPGRFSFVDVTAEAGMSDATRTWGSTWNDYNEDGRPDLWIGRHWRQPRLFSNLGAGQFRETGADDFKLEGIDRHACVWGEANGDGRADLYCVRGADKGIGSGANQLFIQDSSGTFVNEAEGSGVSNPNGRGRTANWLDYDGDGDLDLFAGNLTRPGFPNAMFRNDGDIFTQVEVGLSHVLSTVSSSWADWDLDGDPDLLVLQHDGHPAVAYENSEGNFAKVELANITGEHWNAAAWDDFDGDGRPDVHLISPTRSRIVRNTSSGFETVDRMALIRGRMSVWLDVDNDSDLDAFVLQGSGGKHPAPEFINRPDFLLVNSNGRFKMVEHESLRGPQEGNGDAVSASDFDRDGRVDLFITNGLFYWTGPNQLLRNRSEAGNWVGIDIDGDPRNPMGYGATVSVRIEGRTIYRQITDGANYRSQNETGYLHVGLADAKGARVRIHWPDGTSDCTLALAGTVAPIIKGSSSCSDLH